MVQSRFLTFKILPSRSFQNPTSGPYRISGYRCAIVFLVAAVISVFIFTHDRKLVAVRPFTQHSNIIHAGKSPFAKDKSPLDNPIQSIIVLSGIHVVRSIVPADNAPSNQSNIPGFLNTALDSIHPSNPICRLKIAM
ncbi:predicted protein [Lichtheimia corymbifera JMRC:FSU:9682]|uniref:Uncharacterized protein n=1 Tax=Lichtheimia corymbifera JMRC:FSU:9682 TaxID=1263082 RepID=A0A068RZX9_9FUNG|nr:predicted protein [Lichtheimia corymbifera JMRC:FSU:9682]